MRTFTIILLTHLALTIHGFALTYGLFSYTDHGTSITITDYPTTATGDVVIPETIDGKPVTSIGSNAFNSCRSLTGMSIPDSVLSIGYDAFVSCNSLTNVTLGASVTSIGSYAFSGCSSLTAINIPDLVITIDICAFRDCSALTSVTIGNSVTTIGSNAFKGCSSLNEIAIPDSIISLGNGAFTGCTSLTNITLGASVASISDSAFASCRSLKEITLPGSVTSIGDGAFTNCTSLTSVTIPDSVNSIGGGAFSRCSSLTAIILPDSVTSIDQSTFRDCTSLNDITVSSLLTSIDHDAFRNCASLTSFTIPNTVTEIGYFAFAGCTALSSINIPIGVRFIGASAFRDCTALTEITTPNTVHTIENYAFRNCTSLTSFTLSGYVKTLDPDIFYNCPELKSITVDPANSSYSSIDGILYDKSQTTIIYCPNAYRGAHAIPSTVTTVNQHAFRDCRNLTEIFIPDGVIGIGFEAFLGCSSLANVNLPSNLDYISNAAFKDCRSLTEVHIPNSVTALGFNSFIGCSMLTTAIIPSTLADYGGRVFSGCPQLTQIVLPDIMTNVSFKEFSFCTELTSVSLAAAITSIDSTAFAFCQNLATIHIDPANTSLVNNSGVVYTFDMTKLVRCPPAFTGAISIPATVTSIQAGAFDDCGGITAFNVDPANSDYKSQNGVLFNQNLTTLIRCPAGFNGTLPIPTSVTTIESDAFAYCTGLASFEVDPANPNFSSDDGVLFNKHQTTLIRCPSGFSGSVEISNSVTHINSDAFDDCYGVPTISVATGNANYASYGGALYNHDFSELIKCPAGFSGTLTLSPSVTTIAINACRNCTSLTGVILPSGVRQIDGYAFLNCTALGPVTIPASMTKMSWGCFTNCHSMANMTFLGNAPTLLDNGGLYSTTSGNPTVSHFDDSIGFPTINWKGYPVANMGAATPIKEWLINEGLGYDQDPEQDLNGDGVALLTAYALGLDPRQHLAAQMPQPTWTGSGLTLEFYAAAPGVTYTVKCSDDLVEWTTTGIDLSPIDVDGMRTATLPLSESCRFMRLVFAE